MDECFPEKALATAATRDASQAPSDARTCGWRMPLSCSNSNDPDCRAPVIRWRREESVLEGEQMNW